MKKTNIVCGAVALVAMLASCNAPKEEVALSGLKRADFQAELQGKSTDLFILKNASGMEVCVTNYGGRVVSIMVPDKDGQMKDVCIGQPSVEAYNTNESDFGATIGQYANRIAGGTFTIDSVQYQLPQNNYGHCLHGGCSLNPAAYGFEGEYMGWQYKVMDVVEQSESSITLAFVSPDMEAGFPGNVNGKVVYTVTDDNALDIKWYADTDKKTIINMCSHLYFNLNGDYTTPITNCKMWLNADNFTPVDSTFMTTGEIAPVAGTPMDFTTPKAIGQDIDNYDYDQLKNGNGYDHNWVLNTKGCEKCPAARVVSPVTGIKLEVYTNEPGIQVYTGNFLDGTVNGKNGQPMEFRTAVCLETQHFPDSPNKGDMEGWYSCVLNPGEQYYSHCIYKFSVCDHCGQHAEGESCCEEQATTCQKDADGQCTNCSEK